jgi:hypothetical protein
VPNTGDLFDIAPPPSDWRSCQTPEQRLSRYATDPSVATAPRREAADVLARFRSITEHPAPLPAPTVRILGMLMLVP